MRDLENDVGGDLPDYRALRKRGAEKRVMGEIFQRGWGDSPLDLAGDLPDGGAVGDSGVRASSGSGVRSDSFSGIRADSGQNVRASSKLKSKPDSVGKFTHFEKPDVLPVDLPDSKPDSGQIGKAVIMPDARFDVGRDVKPEIGVEKKPSKRLQSRLLYREHAKPLNGKLRHAADIPKREAAVAFHSEIRRHEDGNVGTETAHYAEESAEGAVRMARNKYLKFQPQRAGSRSGAALSKSAARADIRSKSKLLYERSLRSNPELRNAAPLRKALHKRGIRRQYAKMHRQQRRNMAAKATVKTAAAARVATVRVVRFVAVNWKVFAIIGAAFLLLILLMSCVSSCMSFFNSGVSTVIMTSYTAEDEDILGAEADYAALASQLLLRVFNIENEFPGYDEYRFDVDQVGHDPHVLASYLSARFLMYTREQVQAELHSLFAQQYTLTLTPITETRYRTETRVEVVEVVDPVTGEVTSEEREYEVEVAYTYHILEVSLRNHNLANVVLANLAPDELEMFHVYMETRGNRPELFEDNNFANRDAFMDFDVPPEALSDVVFANMLREAEKFLGWPYVWGGSSPATSFDCSGFVSWVINNSGNGWNVGRLTANGLWAITTPVSPANARPGDLIFFHSTYNTPLPISHVGIYVGGGHMIHAGNPISFVDITSPYWVRHFYGFGRIG